MLHILDYDADRQILDREIGYPSKSLMLVRGNAPGVGAFAQRADQATVNLGWRTVIWMRVPLLSQAEEAHYFGDSNAVAVLLDLKDRVAFHFAGNEPFWQIQDAFDQAEARP